MTNYEIAKSNYTRGFWTNEMITNIFIKGLISLSEFKDIIGEIPSDIDINIVKTAKVTATKTDLEIHLMNHPLTWTDGNQYSVTTDKQNRLTSHLALYQTATAAGAPYTLEWNTTGGECTEWTYEGLVALALAIGAYVKPLVSYQQAKEVEIMACSTIEEIDAIVVDYTTLTQS